MIEFQLLVKVLILLIVIFIIFTIYKYLLAETKKYENFDVLQKDINKEQCGRICTKSPLCKGFAFDINNKECYLSKEYILGKPNIGVYLDKYKNEQLRCNKLRPISIDSNVIKDIPEILLRDNTLYLCSNNEDSKYDYYKIVNEKMEKIEKKDINTLPYEEYELKDIDWNNSNTDTIKKELLISVNKEKDNLKPHKIFDKDSREYLGQYFFPYKCVSDISLGECLRFCNNESKCIGTEWNPLYIENDKNNKKILHKNVCCPKIKIREIVERRKKFENGNFYVKSINDDISKDNKNIYISIDKIEYK